MVKFGNLQKIGIFYANFRKLNYRNYRFFQWFYRKHTLFQLQFIKLFSSSTNFYRFFK